jgi:hypothetical protein
MWFKLIFIGGGGTFQKLGPVGARGWPTGSTTGPVGLLWAPLGVHFRLGGSLILLDASFLVLSHVEFQSVLESSREVSLHIF